MRNIDVFYSETEIDFKALFIKVDKAMHKYKYSPHLYDLVN